MSSRIKLSSVSCRRGSPMGRASDQLKGKCKLQRMRMVDLCYDEGGVYWGAGSPDTGYMYLAEDAEGNQAFTRAKSREHAKRDLLSSHNNITFHR